MLRIAICDDEETQRRQTAALVEEYLRARPELPARVSLFADGRFLLDEPEGFDLYLLDVIMPEVNGIRVGKTLRELSRGGLVIYLTTSRDYAVDSYRAGAFDYLLKPIDRALLFETLDRAAAELKRRKTETTVVQTAEGLRSIPLDDILYLERWERCVRYYLVSGDAVDSRALRGSFEQAVAPVLSDSRFHLCGASFAVNLAHVRAVERTEAVLDCGVRVPLSRAAQANTKQAWVNYWLGGNEA